MDNFRYKRDLTWEEIFAQWTQNESHEEGWQKTAQKKGWANWKEWRTYLAETLLGLHQKEWKLYGIDNPIGVIPQFLVGPFNSWQKIVPPDKINEITFREYLELDVQRWKTHGKVQELLNNVPLRTQLIGLIEPETSRIVCVEGTHRCMSVTLASHEGIQLATNREIEIALAPLGKEGKEFLLKTLYTGSHKPQ